MTREPLIYGLVDPRTDEVRYIGKSLSGLRRLREHGTARDLASGTYKARWLGSLLRAGFTFDAVELERPEENELSAAEIRWIAEARACGWRLTNLTNGGDGTPGHVASAKVRKHCRLLGLSHAGRSLTKEHREKVSVAGLGRIFTQTHRDRIAAGNRTRSITDATRAKMSASAAARANSAAGRAHLARITALAADAVRGREVSAEHRARLSDSVSRFHRGV